MVPSKEYAYMNPPYLEESNKPNINTIGELNVKDRLPKEYPEFYSFIYSVEVFMPFLDLHQEAYWFPGHRVENDKGQGKQERKWYDYENLVPFFLHFWMWIEIIIGWVLSTFFVGGVLRLIHELHLHKKE